MSAFLSQGPIGLVLLILLMGFVVVIHELGHYLAGRFFGAAVESFSVGFGKPIFERRDKRGTRWRINWIPLGGFVKFVGESQLPGDVERDDSGPVGKPYPSLGVGARSIVSAAGPAANFILAILLFAIMFFANGTYETRVYAAALSEEGAAAQAGMLPGDIFVSVDGVEVKSPDDILMKTVYSTGNVLPFVVERDGALITLEVTPERKIRKNTVGQMQAQGTIGAEIAELSDHRKHITYGPVEALGAGVNRTGETLALTTSMLGRIITGAEPISNLSGPVAIGDTSRRIFNMTMGNEELPFSSRSWLLFWNMVMICASISVGIGFFNLLPLPVLDGGHLVFNAYEAVTGKLLPAKVQEAALTAGLVLLLGLFVVITWGDVLETGLFNSPRG